MRQIHQVSGGYLRNSVPVMSLLWWWKGSISCLFTERSFSLFQVLWGQDLTARLPRMGPCLQRTVFRSSYCISYLMLRPLTAAEGGVILQWLGMTVGEKSRALLTGPEEVKRVPWESTVPGSSCFKPGSGGMAFCGVCHYDVVSMKAVDVASRAAGLLMPAS